MCTIRYKITLQYDGNYINGWHGNYCNQASFVFVFDFLQSAIFKLTQETTHVVCASRTDSGVHAQYQVCHFDLVKNFNNITILKGLNFYLPQFIRIMHAEQVNNNFHARFSAKQRIYEYLIYNNYVISPFWYKKALFITKKLDINLMQRAIPSFVNRNDLSTCYPNKFTGNRIRTIDFFKINNYIFPNMISVIIGAKSFIHHQIRNIIGCLIMIGLKKWTIIDLEFRLDQKNRIYGTDMAHAHGLYLQNIIY